MTRAQQIIDWLTEHPGSLASEIEKALGFTRWVEGAHSYLGYLTRNGTLERLGKRGHYRYRVAGKSDCPVTQDDQDQDRGESKETSAKAVAIVEALICSREFSDAWEELGSIGIRSERAAKVVYKLLFESDVHFKFLESETVDIVRDAAEAFDGEWLIERGDAFAKDLCRKLGTIASCYIIIGAMVAAGRFAGVKPLTGGTPTD